MINIEKRKVDKMNEGNVVVQAFGCLFVLVDISLVDIFFFLVDISEYEWDSFS